MFPNILKVTVEKDEQGKPIGVRLSVRVTETQVEVHSFSPQEFAVMVSEYQAQLGT